MSYKVILTYKDGKMAEFTEGYDPLELDLDGTHIRDLFSIVIESNGKVIFSAYHWHNDPMGNDF